MTTASQDKITVPGDDRLTKLNVSTKTPFWTKIPIIKELRVAVGWQKGMLITVSRSPRSSCSWPSSPR